jgi:hypothetical protein
VDRVKPDLVVLAASDGTATVAVDRRRAPGRASVRRAAHRRKEQAMTRTHIVGATMIAIVLVGLAPTGTLAQVQNRIYQDSMGRNTGRSVTDSRGNTTYYDNMGRNTGRSVTSGGTTTIYDNMGRQTGTVRSK